MPEIQSRAASLFSFASCFSSPFSFGLLVGVRALPVAMMRLVVDDDDVLHLQAGRRRRACSISPSVSCVMSGSLRQPDSTPSPVLLVSICRRRPKAW